MDNTPFAPGNKSIHSTLVSAPQYSPPERKHFVNKKFAVTFLVLLLIGGAACAGMWLWSDQQASQVIAPTFTPRPDETAGWKTYTNTQYGFEFKYPNSWETGLDNLDKVNNRIQAFSTISTERVGEGNADFAVSFYPDSHNGDLDQACFYKDLQNDSATSNLSHTSFLSMPAIYSEDIASGPPVNIYCFLRKGIKFEVSQWTKHKEDILSTFKFTSPNSGPTMCTMEAKLCPDGSYVGRTGPNCEFTACPK